MAKTPQPRDPRKKLQKAVLDFNFTQVGTKLPATPTLDKIRDDMRSLRPDNGELATTIIAYLNIAVRVLRGEFLGPEDRAHIKIDPLNIDRAHDVAELMRAMAVIMQERADHASLEAAKRALKAGPEILDELVAHYKQEHENCLAALQFIKDELNERTFEERRVDTLFDADSRQRYEDQLKALKKMKGRELSQDGYQPDEIEAMLEHYDPILGGGMERVGWAMSTIKRAATDLAIVEDIRDNYNEIVMKRGLGEGKGRAGA